MAMIEKFYVMEILERARARERAGEAVIHLELGEPDFATPAAIVAAGQQALREGRTHYVEALGIPDLRQRIAADYPTDIRPDVSRVVVTPGSSGALQMIFGVLIDPGDQVLMADPGYPCNANFVRLYDGEPVMLATDATSNYQLTPQMLRENWTDRTRAVLLGTPSNPTGSVITPAEMRLLVDTVESLGGVVIVDEIYHGLTYDTEVRTALYDSPGVFVVNSFSKYYGMTGWRIGWLVTPEAYIEDITKLAQNLFISTSTPAQYAALRAFDAAVIAELEHRREIFRQRRDYIVPALRGLGFSVPVEPNGAFYVYADCSAFDADSERFALELLAHAGVGITPGRDFGVHRCSEHVRISYANTLENLQLAVARIGAFIGGRSADE